MLALCIESSHARGMGHLFRALNLADGLRERGLQPIFLLNAHTPAQDLLAKRGYAHEVVPLGDHNGWEGDVIERHGVRLWINDRLNTDAYHARQVKALGLPLVTFDDRGEGAALSDLNVAALVFDAIGKLQGQRILQGPDYLILDPEIARFQRLRKRVDSLLVTLGGSDTYGVTVGVVRHLAAAGRSATVIVGPAFAHLAALEQALTPAFELKIGVPSLIAEFSRHDLAITGGGVTPFEAAASGLPCVVVANEHFEVPVGQVLAGLGVAAFAGHHETLDWRVLSAALPIESMSRAGLERVGLQGRQRVLDVIATYL